MMRNAVIAALVVTGIVACTPYSAQEVFRTTDPRGEIDAIVLEGSAGATTSYEYEIHIVRHGAEATNGAAAATLHRAIRNDNRAFGVNLRWVGPEILVVEYLSARSAIVRTPKVNMGKKEVSIVLRGGINDPSAPPGGMLYNLLNRDKP